MSVNKKYKDLFFRKIFGSEENKAYALDLYNALNNSSYTDINDLEFTTIDDVVYMGISNDVSFLIQSVLPLYEHQSSFNPNMPVRGLMYYGRLYDAYISKHNFNRYGTKLIKLPTPQYVVFYNGTKDVDDSTLLRLSDSFQVSQKENTGEIYEWTAKMININFGHNKELMQKCKPLSDYAELIETIRQSVQVHGVEAGVRIGIDICITRNLFRDILLKNKSEVIGMFLTHYDQQEQIQIERAEAKAEGRTEGKAEGRNLINELNNLLVSSNRIEDLKRSTEDLDFQNKLLIEFGLIEK